MVAFEAGSVDEIDVAGGGIELVFVDAGFRAVNSGEDALTGDFGGAANNGDFAGALDAAELVEDGCNVFDFGLRVAGFEESGEVLFAGNAGVPGVGALDHLI